jgi:hypothetical protein
MRTGVYTYRIRRIDGTYEQYKMPVEILDERQSTFCIKFLHVHADGRGFGSKSWVRKNHVYIIDGTVSLYPRKMYYQQYKD